MLGEKIGEISGKVTMQRVVPNLGGDAKMETCKQHARPDVAGRMERCGAGGF